MNISDSERIAAVLESLGFKQSFLAEGADLIIFNMCSVRQSAIDRAKSKIKMQNAKCKMTNQNSKIILTGCILKKDKRELTSICDAIFDINDLSKLPALLKNLGFKIRKPDKKKVEHYLQITPEYQSDIVAYVPIMTGCNNFCAYCVVPYVRGREISRPAKEILCEIKNLIKRGTKEIWLLGQNVNSYRTKIKNQKSKCKMTNQNTKLIDFTKLLRMVNDIEGDFWLRFTSSHPKDLTDEMIEIFAKCRKVTPYFNLPVQSGDDEILKAMNRPYTIAKYKTLIEKTRSAFKKYREGLEKHIAISTDVIVGFPGETKKQFENTKKVFQEIGFASAYVSRYSPRPQTAAYKLKDNVSSQEKKQREKKLTKIIEKSALRFNKQFVGKTVDVLILKEKNGFYFGKTRHYQTIKFPADKKGLVGNFVQAKVTKALDFGLKATNETRPR